MEILAWTIAILTSAGTVLMAIKGIMNSKDYREAKEAIIQSKDATIERKQADIDSLKLRIPSFILAEQNDLKELAEQHYKRLTKTNNDLEQELKELSQLYEQTTLEKGASERQLEKEKQSVDNLTQIVYKAHKDIVRLEENLQEFANAPIRQTRLSDLLEGKVFRASPPMISVYKQPPFLQTLSQDEETMFPQPKENDKTE